MPRHWTESFDFYLAEIDDKTVSLLVDLGAAEHGPLLTHPKRVLVRLGLKTAKADGLPDESETHALGELEERVVEALEKHHDAIYVGRSLGTGLILLFAYVADAADNDALAASVNHVKADYTATLKIDRDPEWSDYFEFLFPDEYALQAILNRRVVQALADSGDDLTIPRNVDHHARFATRAHAMAAGIELTSLGYEVDSPAEDEKTSEWSLDFRRLDSLEETRVDAMTWALLDVMKHHEGDYDGWGCELAGDPDGALDDDED